MNNTTLVFLKDPEGQVLLAMKKRGFGAGKWNGAGGKVHADETVVQAIQRELEEEFLLRLPESAFESMGHNDFYFDHKPDWNQRVHIFVATHDPSQVPMESEEMLPKWFNIGEIPWGSMWEADKLWIPGVLAGKKVNWSLWYDENNSVKKSVNHEDPQE